VTVRKSQATRRTVLRRSRKAHVAQRELERGIATARQLHGRRRRTARSNVLIDVERVRGSLVASEKFDYYDNDQEGGLGPAAAL